MATPSNENLAAILPSAKAPLKIQTLPIPTPGPGELLIKTSIIALNAIEAKIALFAPFPVPYPSILGFSFSGTIEAVGDGVKTYHIGEHVLVSKRFGTEGNAYGAYQRYVLVAATEKVVARVPADEKEKALVGMLMNAVSVAGLLSGRLGLRRPGEKGESKKILIYGGTSSMGRLAIQYLSCAGYQVTATSSHPHCAEIRKLGAETIIHHTDWDDQVTDALKTWGPYDVVVDMISSPSTISITSKVLEAQGGGKVYAMQPAFGPEELPEGVQRVFEPWPESLYEEENKDLLDWVLEEYLPKGIEKGWMTAQPWEKAEGGLAGINAVLKRVLQGNGNTRLVDDHTAKSTRVVVDPWA